MTDREYLRSLGFTVGERGRFSKEMLEALANRDSNDEIDESDSVVALSPRVPVRIGRQLYGLTKDGYKVGFAMCSRCAEHMIWCECPNGVMAPDNVAALEGEAKDIAILHPRMVHLTSIA